MKKRTYKFSNTSVDYYFAGGISYLKNIVDPGSTVLVTDENIYAAHTKKFRNWNTIVLQPGEDQKIQETVDEMIGELISMKADRKTSIVGVGGGVVCDLTGYVASVYMRGIRFGFIPTSLLALVDASVGGKNGIDVGLYKNLVGTIRQPSFILHDIGLLGSLPQAEWENGFAEIIKHACIKDAAMFRQLEENSFNKYHRSRNAICELVEKNVMIKTRIVQRDEFETGERRLLNFGHTLGHALENQYELSHGHAVSIGMTYACRFSEQVNGFSQTDRVANLLEKYNLPTFAEFDRQKVMNVLEMDKKREQDIINYVLLERIGKGVVKPVEMERFRRMLSEV